MSFRASKLMNQALQSRQMTVRALAKAAGMPVGSCGMILSGKRRLPLGRFAHLVQVLKLTPTEARALAVAVLEDHGGQELLPYIRGSR